VLHGFGLENARDPGWGPVLRPMVWFLIPGVGVVLFRKHQSNHPTHGLTLLRVLFIAFTIALVLIGAVIAVLVNLAHFRGGKLSAIPIAIGVTVIGVAGLAARQLFDRRLDCSDDLRLATTYRERFFVRITFSEAASLAGFAGFILTSRWWLYPLGAVFTAVGYARLVPTSAHLSHDQHALTEGGCGRSLIAALAGLPRGHASGGTPLSA
jgi:hypothetical protein